VVSVWDSLRRPVSEEFGDAKAKVGTERVNEHGSTHIYSLKPAAQHVSYTTGEAAARLDPKVVNSPERLTQ
jgi:hypothetical protein